MYRVLNKKRKILLAISCVLIVILLVMWGFSFYRVNSQAFRQDILHYSMGENVELDGNFFSDGRENTKGYSICVNSAEIRDKREYLKSYGVEDKLIDDAKYICLLNVTVINEGNDDGIINTIGFGLYNAAVQIPIDFEIWEIIDDSYFGDTYFKLRKDSQVTLTIPFTPQGIDAERHGDSLNKRIENEAFDFVISEFPQRKLISVTFENNA